MALPFISLSLLFTFAFAAPLQSIDLLSAYNPSSDVVSFKTNNIIQRRAEAVNNDFFQKVILAEQYAAASYCPLNSETSNSKIRCGGACPLVEGLENEIIVPLRTLPKGNNVTGFVADDDDHDRFVISFRGTQSKKDLFRDITFILVPAPQVCWRCAASYGFWSSWNDVKKGVVDSIDAASKGRRKRRIMVTGHSLGGGIASVAAADLRAMGYVTDLYTFGSPRFANKAFVEHLMETSPEQGINVRVTHTQDPIVGLPFDFLDSGHVDLFPEYYISSPTNASVNVKDIKILRANEFMLGSSGQMPKAIEAHSWYFDSITACANGTWLEGDGPSNEDFAGIAVGFLENWAWGMVDSAFNSANDALSKALGAVGIKANPKIPSPTTLLPAEARGNLIKWLIGKKDPVPSANKTSNSWW